MKRVLSLVILTAMLLALCACGNTKTASQSQPHSVDIAYYAILGRIPELSATLGDNPDELLAQSEQSSSAASTGDEDVDFHVQTTPQLTKIEGQLSVSLNGGSYVYYYEKEKAANGISAIVSFNKAYDFETGSPDVTSEIIQAAIPGYAGEFSTPTADDMFFLPDTGTSAKCLTYIFNDRYKLQFFFIDGVFSAVMLSDIQNWTI